MASRIEQVKTALSGKNPQLIISALSNANRISRTQIQANKSQIQGPVALVLSEMGQVLPLVYRNSDSSAIKRIMRQLGSFRSNFAPVMTPNMVAQVQYLVQLGGRSVSQNVAKSLGNTIEKQIQNDILKTESNANSSKIDLKLQAVQSSILQQKADSTIQTQIAPISSFLSRNIDPINPNVLPNSIQILANYAQSKNLQRFGSVSGSKSRAYIGVSQQKDGMQSHIVPFPQQRGLNGNTPNLMQNFNFFAGKAINAWNKFVRTQQELTDYMGKIATKQLRKVFVQQRISQMTQASFSAEALATLVYYYVQIPLERFLRTGIEKYDGTQQSFSQNYMPGDGMTKNPFLLATRQARQIYLLLFSPGVVPTTLELRLTQMLQKFKTGLNAKRINQWINYAKGRSFSARQFFQTSGLSTEMYNKTLESGFIVGVKTKRFIIPPMFTNPQIVQMVNQVSQKQNSQSAYSKLWRLSWGDEKMMSHDYVWNFEL